MGKIQKTVLAESYTLNFAGLNVQFPSTIMTQVILDKNGTYKSSVWLECNMELGAFILKVFFEELLSVQAKNQWIAMLSELENAFPKFKMLPRFKAKGALPINAQLEITQSVSDACAAYNKLIKILSKY